MEVLLNRAHARPTSSSPARLLTSGYAPRCDTVAGAVGNTPVLWIDRPLNPEGARLLGETRRRQPWRDEGPSSPPHD